MEVLETFVSGRTHSKKTEKIKLKSVMKQGDVELGD